MLAAHLGAADRGLNGWHPAFGNMSQVIRDLLQAPARGFRPVRKIVTKIMKIDVADELRFCQARPSFELLPPLVDTILSPAPGVDLLPARVLFLALTGEDIRAPFALTLVKVVIQRAARF